MEWKRPPIRECRISTKGRKEEEGVETWMWNSSQPSPNQLKEQSIKRSRGLKWNNGPDIVPSLFEILHMDMLWVGHHLLISTYKFKQNLHIFSTNLRNYIDYESLISKISPSQRVGDRSNILPCNKSDYL